MQLPDRWNPRLWVRDWLNKSSPAERARRKAIEDWARTAVADIHASAGGAVSTGMDGDATPTEDAELRLSGRLQTSNPQCADLR